ncbi:MAG: hypothetical protein ACRECZ_04625, partial [Methylocella sp.]
MGRFHRRPHRSLYCRGFAAASVYPLRFRLVAAAGGALARPAGAAPACWRSSAKAATRAPLRRRPIWFCAGKNASHNQLGAIKTTRLASGRKRQLRAADTAIANRDLEINPPQSHA